MSGNYNREVYQTISTFKAEYGIHITTEHNGKMVGMASLSTSPLSNEFCQCRSKCKGSICEKCYSMRMQKMFSSLNETLKQNYDILTSQIIPVEKMPIINYLMFRFEAFGDIDNEIQIINYFNMCKRNPRVQFSIWTKNISVFSKLFKNGYNGKVYRKPKNLIIILSSPLLNTQEDKDRYDFVDKVFTVYDKAYAEKNGIEINCGNKSCCACQVCYSKNAVKYINEILK